MGANEMTQTPPGRHTYKVAIGEVNGAVVGAGVYPVASFNTFIDQSHSVRRLALAKRDGLKRNILLTRKLDELIGRVHTRRQHKYERLHWE